MDGIKMYEKLPPHFKDMKQPDDLEFGFIFPEKVALYITKKKEAKEKPYLEKVEEATR